MDAFRIQGGARLAGRIAVDGSKNAALPQIAAALLADGPLTLRNVPNLSDISNMLRLLGELGCEADALHGTITLTNTDPTRTHARYDIVRTMRASICVLGPMLARRGYARVSMPGGCAFGARPVDLHVRGLEQLGAEITLEGGDIVASIPTSPGSTSRRLKGASIFLGGPFGPTVLGTANVMSAATLAVGTTIIESAACEPEVVDLANLLNAMGAKITGAGSPRITIEGVEQLSGADHTVIPDRIVAGTYVIAAAITNGEVILDDFPHDCLLAAIDRLNHAGVHIERLPNVQTSKRQSVNAGEAARSVAGHLEDSTFGRFDVCSVRVTCDRCINPVILTTQPFPGFPTDLQAQMMALLTLANGNSIITEKIYPERFMHVAELARMGASLFREGPTVMVQGVRKLIGAPVMASDLRGSACLVLAGLVAEGETLVSRVYHLDRGYVAMDETLRALGAMIERFDPDAKRPNVQTSKRLNV